MDQATIVRPKITHVEPKSYKQVLIETSGGKSRLVDLSSFEKVYCFPKNNSEWKRVIIDSYGLALVWDSGFEVHIDQLI